MLDPVVLFVALIIGLLIRKWNAALISAAIAGVALSLLMNFLRAEEATHFPPSLWLLGALQAAIGLVIEVALMKFIWQQLRKWWRKTDPRAYEPEPVESKPEDGAPPPPR